MAEAGKETPPPLGSFWDGLLKNQYQQLKALELATMGKVNAAYMPCCGWSVFAEECCRPERDQP
jgi:hypothetical protein